MTQIVRGITVNDLPESPAPGVMLWCAHCQAGFSAAWNDYFWMPRGRAFRCQTCRRPLALVRERITHDRVEGGS
jgi:hypothetical protein